MSKAKQKFIQFSDIIMIIFFGLGVLAFVMFGFLGAEPIYSPEKFIENIKGLQRQLEQVADDATEPTIPNYANTIRKRIIGTISETKSGIDINKGAFSAKSAYFRPALKLDVPRTDVKVYPVDKASIKVSGIRETINVTWAKAENQECMFYKVSWWLKSSFNDDEDYTRPDVRDMKEPAGTSRDREIGNRKIDYKIEGIQDNIEYVIEIKSMDNDYRPIIYPEQRENAWIIGVSVGEEKDIPNPKNLRVVRASLAGIHIMWDPPDYCFEPGKTYPDRSKFAVLLYRWVGEDKDNKVLLTPASKTSPHGLLLSEYIDTDIQPGIDIYYGVRFYHWEDFPDNEQDGIRYLGEQILLDKVVKLRRDGRIQEDPNTKEPVFEPRKVYASKLLELEKPIVLENKPVLELVSITSSENPDNPNSSARIEVTIYTKLADIDDPSVEKYVRSKVRVTVKYEDIIQGDERPLEIDGVALKDSPYNKIRDLRINFTTNLKIVGLYKITYRYHMGHIYTIQYAEIENTDPKFEDCWPFKLYRVRDIESSKGERADWDGSQLKRRGLIPDVELDRQRGFNEEERKELYNKLKNLMQKHNEFPRWASRQPWPFSPKLEDLLFEFSIENEVRFYPAQIIKDFEILKENDQFLKLQNEARDKNW